MATNDTPSTQPAQPELAIPYSPTGLYHIGQRINHPDSGLGTVTQVRRRKIHVLMDSDQHQLAGRRELHFPSKDLTLDESMAANNFDFDGLDTLFDWDLEDFLERLGGGPMGPKPPDWNVPL